VIRIAGEISLIIALIAALIQSVFPLWGYKRKNIYALALARPAAIAQFIFVTSAYVLLTLGFANNDFSISYVAANSHASLPLMYKLTAVWGAHEGSILLWILILNSWTMVYAATMSCQRASSWHLAYKNHPFPLVIAILGIISLSFLCFIIFTSNPFLATVGVQTGKDLNPLLQDPGFVIHPPMLYIGYVGFSVAFAITQAALLLGKLDTHWTETTRRFAVCAWSFLTLGIMLGSWWAYRVLGWGGFWFWDPVENASLLPWLAGTAFIHVLVLVEKRHIGIAWASLLAIICFALSLLGTFLVRSGVLISAHTFANDPERGIVLLILLALLTTAAFIVYLIRLPIANKKNSLHLLSRDTLLLGNSVLFIIAMLTILLGTLYPLILDALHLGAISVGAPYFNSIMLPIVLMGMAMMCIAPLCKWEYQSLLGLWNKIWKKILLSFVLAIILVWSVTNSLTFLTLLIMTLSILIVFSVLSSMRFLPAMFLAHVGFAILIIGILLSSFLTQEREVRVKAGDVTQVGPYQFLFINTTGIHGENYRGIRAAFEVIKNGRHIVNLYPEKRIFLVRDMVMTKVDIHPGIFRDLYIALGEPLNQNEWSVRMYYKPFVRWIWFGAMIMVIGGVVGMLKRETHA